MTPPRSVEEWAASINIAIGCKFYDPWGIPCHYPSDCPSHRAIAVEMSAYAAEQVAQWRETLWLRHGHEGLYGDDGEMQCGICLVDFKRATSQEIIDGLRRSFERQVAQVLADKGAYQEAWARRFGTDDPETAFQGLLDLLHRHATGGCSLQEETLWCPACEVASAIRARRDEG